MISCMISYFQLQKEHMKRSHQSATNQTCDMSMCQASGKFCKILLGDTDYIKYVRCKTAVFPCSNM